jgi:hypothetical protein
MMAKKCEVQFTIMCVRQYWVNVTNCESSHKVPFPVSADLLVNSSGSVQAVQNYVTSLSALLEHVSDFGDSQMKRIHKNRM